MRRDKGGGKRCAGWERNPGNRREMRRMCDKGDMKFQRISLMHTLTHSLSALSRHQPINWISMRIRLQKIAQY
eukprot:1200560-Rhodomonas_salina.1